MNRVQEYNKLIVSLLTVAVMAYRYFTGDPAEWGTNEWIVSAAAVISSALVGVVGNKGFTRDRK